MKPCSQATKVNLDVLKLAQVPNFRVLWYFVWLSSRKFCISEPTCNQMASGILLRQPATDNDHRHFVFKCYTCYEVDSPFYQSVPAVHAHLLVSPFVGLVVHLSVHLSICSSIHPSSSKEYCLCSKSSNFQFPTVFWRQHCQFIKVTPTIAILFEDCISFTETIKQSDTQYWSCQKTKLWV